MIVLLTNDDGISAPGLRVLEETLRRVHPSTRFVTVAPAFPSSGMSRSITLYKPVRSEPVGEDRYQLDGTPADCVLWGLKHLIKEEVRLVISGINHGPNLGDDVAFSGTVSAALEAARYGVPSLALSLAVDKEFDFTHAAEYVPIAFEMMLSAKLPWGVAVSVNIPEGEPRGVAVTRPGRRLYSDYISERLDPFGRPYYWLAGSGRMDGDHEPGTDIEAVNRGFISVTPLDSDFHAQYTDLTAWQRT